MRGFKRSAAALLPAFVTSLVLPNDRAQFPIEQVSTERPATRIPFVYKYRVQEDAFIQFTIPHDGHNTAGKEAEEELISITVSSSDLRSCSGNSNTGIQVNEKTLVSTSQQISNGLVVQRSGTITSTDPTRGPTTWDLQCACLDEASTTLGAPDEDCQDIGYVLNFQLPTSVATDAEGFTLSFSQYKQAKLHHLTTLALSALQLSAATIDDPRNSQHWLSPLLQPLDTLIAKVPTPTISKFLPAFSSTNDPAFRTITTRELEVTPAASIDDIRPSKQAAAAAATAAPSQVAGEKSGSTVYLESDASSDIYELLEEEASSLAQQLSATQDTILDYSKLAKIKQALQQASGHVQSSLESIIQKLADGPSSYQAIKHPELDASRNETREFQEEAHVVIDYSKLPEVSHTHKAIIASLILLVLASGTAFTCIWHRDPRRRAERAARREERINRRLYQNAACRHRWQAFIDRIRGREVYQPQSQTFERAQIHVRRPSGDSDVEWLEKTSSSNEPLGEAGPMRGVRKGIGELRDAYGFVEGILRATSGMYRGPRSHPSASSRGPGQRRASDADSEKSMLPPYMEKEEYEDVVVVDGLHFTLRRRDTPGSSIIATSPLHSDCDSSDGEKE